MRRMTVVLGSGRTVRVWGALGVGMVVVLLGGALTVAAPAAPVCDGTTCTETFNFTGGSQTWTVAPGVTSATFDVYGASGGDGNIRNGGGGGRATATFTVAAGDKYQIVVGGAGRGTSGSLGGAGGFNGGGRGGEPGSGGSFPGSPGAGGGGGSDVRAGACAAASACDLAARILVGGGGGGAVATGGAEAGAGGGGGQPSGGDGQVAQSGGAGIGGSQTAGGAGGAAGGPGCSGASAGGNGGLGVGGAGGRGADATFASPGEGGGGGGGGYYGGGGGGGACALQDGASGGGGSSFGPTGATFDNGVRGGDGVVIVTFADPNHRPTAVADSYSTNEDVPLVVAVPGVLGNDSDPDAGDTLLALLETGVEIGIAHV